ALKLIRRSLTPGHGKKYDLIVSDVYLEGDRSGIDLAEACKQAKIDTPVVLTSGRLVARSPLPVIRKPITFSAFEELAGPFLASPDQASAREVVGKALETLFWILLGWILIAVLLLSVTTPTDERADRVPPPVSERAFAGLEKPRGDWHHPLS